jgi:F-type H+-transporting ATPase subunit b
MDIINNIALITINETLFVQLLSFLIFLFIINRIMFRPLKSTMNERDGYMEKLQVDIADAGNELESLTQQLQKIEAHTKSEAIHVQIELEASGNMEADKILHATLDEIERLKNKNRAQVDAQISEARQHLQKETQILAVSIMEKVLQRRLVP